MTAKVYTDGSSRVNQDKTIDVGWAYMIKTSDGREFKAHGNDIEEGFKPQLNIAGECTAVIRAIEKLDSLEVETATIYHDLQNLGKWVRGEFRTKNPYTTDFVARVKTAGVKTTFVWVKGHNGHIENEIVDDLASRAMNGNIIDEYRIHTGSFWMKWDDNVVPVCVSNSLPKNIEMKKIPALVPPWEIVEKIKDGKITEKQYESLYIAHITETTKKWEGATLEERLGNLLKVACKNAGSRHLALLCWEPEKGFCHRRIIYRHLPISMRGDAR